MAAGELQACANEGLANGLSTVGDRLQIMPGQVSFGRDLNSPDPKEAVPPSVEPEAEVDATGEPRRRRRSSASD